MKRTNFETKAKSFAIKEIVKDKELLLRQLRKESKLVSKKSNRNENHVAELKSSLHMIIDLMNNEELLRKIYDLLRFPEITVEGGI
ncbi:MAG: hypothetical protein WDN75_18635 [Bacteroidota bacterium]